MRNNAQVFDLMTKRPVPPAVADIHEAVLSTITSESRTVGVTMLFDRFTAIERDDDEAFDEKSEWYIIAALESFLVGHLEYAGSSLALARDYLRTGSLTSLHFRAALYPLAIVAALRAANWCHARERTERTNDKDRAKFSEEHPAMIGTIIVEYAEMRWRMRKPVPSKLAVGLFSSEFAEYTKSNERLSHLLKLSETLQELPERVEPDDPLLAQVVTRLAHQHGYGISIALLAKDLCRSYAELH